jgi:stage II sporulation protein AB (anti-sigma F factor)
MKNGNHISSENRLINQIKAVFPAKSVNESLSRMIVSALVCQLDPTVDELADIKTAVSEAVTNCIVHAYSNAGGEIFLTAEYYEDSTVKITVKDKGRGIENVKQAMEPLFTTDESGERSGMGFPIMQSFMDKVKVTSKPGAGTTVTFTKKIKK